MKALQVEGPSFYASIIHFPNHAHVFIHPVEERAMVDTKNKILDMDKFLQAAGKGDVRGDLVELVIQPGITVRLLEQKQLDGVQGSMCL